ncbi:MAG: DUF499 domain-containing protein [Bacteroidia bacterium]|nr:DUF499 domain-containing protein [Bacteroidia bacterium]
MQSLRKTLAVRQSVFDKSYKDVVLDLTDLADGKIDPDRFFAENYITKGMEQLYRAVFGRFDGSIQDGVFKLTQAMGGGKTHSMIAVGLLARFAEYRQPVMGHLYQTSFKGPVKVIAFSGREKPSNGIWGFIAEQLGKKEVFRHLYDNGDAPGQSDWIRLLQGEPVLILLDELPDYLSYTTSVQSGHGTLADKTTRALTTLLNAIGKEELSHIALVISDLQGSYAKGSSKIAEVIDNFEKETHRVAKNFTPVQQNSNEIYHILRKRLFENEASEETIQSIAKAYGEALAKVVKMELTHESPQKLESAIRESYPFHPSMRELYARFKENPGFMQTRGLIRLMRAIVSRMYDPESDTADKTLLIHPYDIDPNDGDIHTELNGINNKLITAISNDIASGGQAAAEKIAEELGNDLPLKTAKLIYMSSLSATQGGVRGLKLTELFAYLAAPGEDIAALNVKILPALRERSWYLHPDKSGGLLYKDVQNISAKINTYRKNLAQEAIRKEIRDILQKLFAPINKDVYQEIRVLPAVDEIPDDKSKVTLVIYQPYQPGAIHPDLQAKYDHTRYKNRLLFLTGDHQSMDTIYENARSIRAAEEVRKEMENEKVPSSDPQFHELENLLDGYRFNFYSAVQNVFTRFFFPTKNGLTEANINLSFNQNKYDGEEQLRKALTEKRKFTTEVSVDAFVLQLQTKLFAGQKKRPWNEVVETAATDTSWLWHKPNVLEQTKAAQLQKDLWREEGSWIHIGPFEKPPTEVLVQVTHVNESTGKTSLTIRPVRGQVVYYDYGTHVSENSPEWSVQEPLVTDEILISFLCVDKEGIHKTGAPYIWKNDIQLKYDHVQQGDVFLVTLRAIPHNVEIRYTTDGSNPLNHGGIYTGAFEAKPQTKILAVATKGEFQSPVREIDLPKAHDTTVSIRKNHPLTYKQKLAMNTTAETYQLVGLLVKFDAKISGITLSSNKTPAWATVMASPGLVYTAQKVEIFLKFVHDELYGEGELGFLAEKFHFPSGQHFLDFARELSLKFKPTDCEQ